MFRNSILLSFVLSVALSGAGLALTEFDLKKLVLEADVLPSDSVRVESKAGKIRITTYRHEKANDDDLKIDSVLVTKEILEKEPSCTEITFYYYDRASNQYRVVAIPPVKVKAFGQGKLTQQNLLAEIVVKLEDGPKAKAQPALVSAKLNKMGKSQHTRFGHPGAEDNFGAEGMPHWVHGNEYRKHELGGIKQGHHNKHQGVRNYQGQGRMPGNFRQPWQGTGQGSANNQQPFGQTNGGQWPPQGPPPGGHPPEGPPPGAFPPGGPPPAGPGSQGGPPQQ